MINKLYYNDLKKALKASFKNGIACYQDKSTNSDLWINRGYIIQLDNSLN